MLWRGLTSGKIEEVNDFLWAEPPAVGSCMSCGQVMAGAFSLLPVLMGVQTWQFELKSGFDSFRIYAVKSLMTELFKILEGMAPDYLSELFVKADNPYDTRDKCKLIQPLKRTTTYGLRSFQYYGAHIWNMLPINIKAAQSLYEFKSFIRSWPGPTCSCQICTALL